MIELLVAAGLYDRKERVPVYEAKGNVPLTIGIEEVYGDISFNLQNFVDFCKEKGIAIDGSISYCGDSDGIQIKLEEFFSTVGESENIVVCDEDGRELARYDGKQSIPLALNHRRVMKVTRASGTVTVIIASEEN